MKTGRFNRPVVKYDKVAKKKGQAKRKLNGTKEKHKLNVKLQARSNSKKKQRLLAHRTKMMERAQQEEAKAAAEADASADVGMADAAKEEQKAQAKLAKKTRRESRMEE